MNPVLFLTLSIVLLLAVVIGIFLYDKNLKKSLHRQAGITAVHGDAAHSLQTEKMRIRKTNREKGVIGELGVAKDLEYLAQVYGLTVLHDLSIPGTTANIDHILVTSKVVYVIDAKNYTGIVKVTPNKAGVKTLRVSGRDQSLLVEKVKKYAGTVEAYLNSEGVEIKVLPLLAFYQAKFHEETAVSIDGVLVNVFGIENELLRYANLRAEEFEPKMILEKLLRGFPPKS